MTLPLETQQVTGWGRTSQELMRVIRPRSDEEALQLTADSSTESYLALGGSRSYGDQGVRSNGVAISSSALDRIVDFDEDAGVLVAESGCKFGKLLDVLLPRGYMVPVTPGTGFATLGGGVANDVHGKNHDVDGGIGRHVEWLDLLCSDLQIRRVSRHENADLFRATVGGSGLTGFILRVCMRLMQVSGDQVRLREQRAVGLDDFFEKLDRARSESQFTVGWIDALARGAQLGRGVVESADLASGWSNQRPSRRISMPFNAPNMLLNNWSVRAFNALYYRRVPAAGRERLAPLRAFYYPLDAILNWNRIYGSRGFYQFQCVVNDDSGRTAIRDMLARISAARLGSFLAVLKTLGGEGDGYLSFPMRGWTLALDFPASPKARALLETLEAITLEHGGRIYLAKDGRLSAEGFEAMYPNLPKFREAVNRIERHISFRSDMSERLGIL